MRKKMIKDKQTGRYIMTEKEFNNIKPMKNY
jgi:hypothetical protein